MQIMKIICTIQCSFQPERAGTHWDGGPVFFFYTNSSVYGFFLAGTLRNSVPVPFYLEKSSGTIYKIS